MKQKKFVKKVVKKALSSLLVVTLVAGLSACGSAEVSKETSEVSQNSSEVVQSTATVGPTEVVEEKSMYPIEGDVTLTLAMVDNATVNAYAKNLFDTPLGKAWQEATGVNIEVIQCANDDAIKLLMAGGDLPDLIYVNTGFYTGGAAKAIEDGVFEPLNDYMEYAPDLKAALESNKMWENTNKTPNGDIIGAPFIKGDEKLLYISGLMIRQDWLDDLGMDIPQTPDEFIEVLRAFKEKKGATIPFTLTNSSLSELHYYGAVTTPFDLVMSMWYQVDGKLKLGFAEPGFKDTLAFLHTLYSEGLLDPNFMSNDNNICRSNMVNGVSGVTYDAQGGGLGNILKAGQEKDSAFDLRAMAPLVAKDGDVVLYGGRGSATTYNALVMTPECKNKEAAVKFMNYGYTEEGHMLLNFGIEGESYTMVDGYPTYTELITNNPDGLTMQQALMQYTVSASNGPMIQDGRYMEQYAATPQQKEALVTWSGNNMAAEYEVPILTIAEEDVSEFNMLWADMITYIKEMIIKYITGEASLDNYETEFRNKLDEMELDRILELRQNALDEFYSR